jgi:hypothetical protein
MTRRSLSWALWASLRWLGLGHASLWPFAGVSGAIVLVYVLFGKPELMSLGIVSAVAIAVVGPLIFARALLEVQL